MLFTTSTWHASLFLYSCLIAHCCTLLQDIVAYFIAFLAVYVQGKDYKPPGFTYALHRAELVGAFFNGVFLLALALSIFLQSVERFINIDQVKDPFSMLIVGCVGLALNLLSAAFVHGGYAIITTLRCQNLNIFHWLRSSRPWTRPRKWPRT